VVKAVVFDLDGVITDSTGYHLRSWQRVAAEMGLDLEPDISERLKGLTREASLELILQSQSRQFTASEKASMLERKNRYYQEFAQNVTSLDVLPGAERLIGELKASGQRLAVASASRNADLILTKLALKPLFDAIVDGNQISRSKPDPEVYLRALSALGVKASEAVAIEDAAAGVAAAKAAGMKCVGIGSISHLSGADLIVGSIDELSASDLLEL
jgi:beta-phosphoglucomutase